MAAVVECPVTYDNMEVSCIGNTSLQLERVMKLWDEYVLETLMERTPCEIGIYEWKGNRTVVTSSKFNISPEELNHIKEGLEYTNLVYKKGITVGGVNYNVQLADGKYGIYARNMEKGCTVCKTFKLLLIATSVGGVAASKCNEEIMRLGDYLQRLGL